jgi:uncharacterized protein (TIGR03437 family)
VKQAFWFWCAIIVSVLAGGALAPVAAQTTSPTPDTFAVQLTNAQSAAFSTVIGDMSADGRFVVFVSNADVATERVFRNNADGNREIFLADYAQRRIFQLTNTKNVPNPVASPSPTPTPSPTPSPSPTPTPAPTPADPTLVKILIDNRSPMISMAPALVSGLRTYTIVFHSNAPDPNNFDGTEGTLAQDANTEIWIYRFSVADVDLTLGLDLPGQDLNAGTFTQITNTPASRLPTAGVTGANAKPAFYADDNREPAVSDDGNILAFISTRNLVTGVGNTDGNPELFLYNVSAGTFTQGTQTQDVTLGVGLIFQSNPNLSATGSVVSFTSSANLASNNADNNAEIFIASFSGSALSNVRQVTRTLNSNGNTNVFSPGRRMSRDGGYIAFESRSSDPKANSATTSNFLGTWVYTVSSDSFVEVGLRPTSFTDITHFPTFTDYNGTTTPTSLVYASALNFRANGTFPEAAADNEGLNPQRRGQIFLTQLPASSSNTFIRLTNVPATTTFSGLQPVTTDTRKRMSFVAGVELGGGNFDGSLDLFYLLSPNVTAQSSAALSFFTAASNMPVAAATPAPTPSASPTPTPSPTPLPSPVPGSPIGVAPGEEVIVRSTIPLAPSNASAGNPATCCSETKRSPALPVELNGVSVSVNGHAAGLYFVGNAEKQINFVVPPGALTGVANVVINILDAGANTDTILRGNVLIVPAQPDIFTSTMDAGGRASAFNAVTFFPEPFSVTTNGSPTVIQLNVTGVRFASPAEISVTVGTTVISGAGIVAVHSNPEMAGWDIINFTLPDSLAGAGDVPIQVTFTRANVITTVSRPPATAPHITIN